MKKILLWGILAATICSCSLLQRHDEEEEPTATEANSTNPLESEVAKLNTKIAALETKLDVLSSNLERMQIKESQPVIEASDQAPEPTMAIPVESPTQISAVPARPTELPEVVKSHEPISSASVEKEFRTQMVFFQNGNTKQASAGFSALAKKYPQHLLASHALYWAGESAAREEKWSTAIENWAELENAYPRSAYIPETLAGLSRAHEKQGNAGKAAAYRDTLLRAFPKSPTAMSFLSNTKASNSRNNQIAVPHQEETPEYESEEKTTEAGE